MQSFSREIVRAAVWCRLMWEVSVSGGSTLHLSVLFLCIVTSVVNNAVLH